MFPVVPTKEDDNFRQDVAVDRTDTVQDEPAASPDAFVVPKPAPDKPKPQDVATEPATADTFTHYVHLADGRVLRADLSKVTEHIGNRYYENRGEDNEFSAEIIGVYPR